MIGADWYNRTMQRREVRYLVGLSLASAVSVGLLIAGSLSGHELLYPYLIWNLFLAWLPLGLAYGLHQTLKRKLWSSWEAIIVTLAWVVLLPNSFYIISDFVHLSELRPRDAQFGAIVFTAFVFTGLYVGVTSLSIVHKELLKRVSRRTAAVLVGTLLFLSSVAIYVGRDLRWNSWDVVFNPFGLLFDLSDRVLHPEQYGQILSVVLPFFILLATIYYVFWQVVTARQVSKQ